MLRDAADRHPATGLVEFDRLQIEPLRDLAAHLPLPEGWRTDLARFAPRGVLTRGRLRWEGPPEAPITYFAAAEFADLGAVAQDALPGANRLTGSFEARESGGELKLATRNGTLELPKVFVAPIPLDSMAGIVTWEHKGGRTRIDLRRLEFANAQAAGSLTGTYRTAPQGPGEIDLAAQLTRANAAEVHRYLPLSSGDEVRSLAPYRSRQGRPDRRPAQGRRQPRRISVRRRQGWAVPLHGQGEGSDASPMREDGRRWRTSTPTCVSKARR